jgi:hypothetical protein
VRIRIHFQKSVEKVTVSLGLFWRYVFVVVDNAEEEVHPGRNVGRFLKQIKIVLLYIGKFGIRRWTNDLGVVDTLVAEFLVHAVVEIVQPFISRFAVLEIAGHECYRTFSAETTWENVLLGDKDIFLIGKIFGSNEVE